MVTDLSNEGDLALSEAARQAAELGAELCVVHAIPHIDAIRPLFPQRLADESVITAELPSYAEQVIRARLTSLNLEGVKVEIVIGRGTTVEVGLETSERLSPGLVVIGAGDDAVDAVRLVRHLTCPLLVVRPSPETGLVVAGTDLSDPSLPAIHAAREASARLASELLVAHAIEVNPLTIYGVALPPMFNTRTPAEIHDAAKARLEQAVKESGATEARTTVIVGSPPTVLLDLARQARLMVVATHGRTGLTRFVLGSVAETVIRRAPCSVLVVRSA